jgi:drug/metabolite transporter (DMT)-like permease
MESRSASGRRRRVTGRGLGLLALSVTVLIWGSTFVVSDVALTEMGPATLTFARFVVSLLVLLPFGIARGLTIGGMFRRSYAVCGLTGVALYYGLQNLGLRFTTPDSVALLQAGLPVLTVGLGVFWLGEAISVRRVVYLGLSVLGMLLVAGRGDGGAGQIGDAAVLGGVAAYAFYTAYARRIAVDTDPLVLASAANVWGLVFRNWSGIY